MRGNSRLIKFLATIMTAVIFITGTAGTELFVNNVAAGTTRTFSEIKSMLDTKMTQSGYKPGGNPPSSYTSGSGSYGFMDMITRYLFGHGLASQGSNPYEFASNYTTNFTRIGNSLTISSGNLTESGLKNLFSQAKPGDVVTMDYTKYDGTDSRHTVMVYSVSSTGVVFYHGGSSKVYFGASTGSQPLWGTGGRTLTWSQMLGFLRKSDDGLTIYRSKYAIADDTTGPSITITSFSETTDGQLKIEYKITDNSGIKNFYIYYNNVKDYSNTSSSTSTSRTGTDYYDPGDNYNGTITVKIVATDNKGNSTTYTKNISFDNRPPDTTGPSITLSYSVTTDGQLRIDYQISDSAGIKKYEIYYNNVLDYSNTSSSTSTSRTGTDYYDPGDNFNGTITVKIVATDNNNNANSYTKNITFDNRPAYGDFRYTVRSNNTIEIIDYLGSSNSVTIPSSINGKPVTSISSEAFSSCISLESITIPDSVTSIGHYAFFNCESLTNITIPDGVTSIEEYTFSGCISLENITMPDSVTSIGCRAFFNCASLTSITIPDSVTSIDDRAFLSCTSLESITIPDGVTSIEAFTFYGCESLESITIPDSVTSIGSQAFFNCASLTSITIPNSVTEIGREAFRECRNLSSVTLSNNLESISYAMFGSCESLRNITIPEGVVLLDSCAFFECSNLNNITVPASVIEIRDSVFSNCSNLEEVRFLGMNEIDFGWNSEQGAYDVESIFRDSDNYVVYCYENSGVHVFSEERDWNYVVVSTVTPTSTPAVVPAPGAIPPATGNTVDRSAAEAFVTRCYELVLGRSPDSTGLNNWTNSLVNNQNTGAHMAYGFFFSQEYLNSNTSNEEFVTTLYNVFLDRAPDQGGLNDWVGQLNAGASREQVFAGVANSREFFALCNSYGITAGHYIQGIDNTRQQNVNAFVARLYSMCLGRVGDYDGQASWVRQLINHENSGAGVGYGFFFSQEFINRNLTNEEYVATLYRVFLGREPDQAGFNSWVSQLNGGADRLSIFRGFAHSQEYTNICSSYGIDRGSI